MDTLTASRPFSAAVVAVRSTFTIALTLVMALTASAQDHGHARGAALPHDVPDFAANPSTRALRSGVWSDQGIWSSGRVPQSNDIVLIPAAIKVTYDATSDTPVQVIGINGSLVFATNRTTRLLVGTIEVFEDGYLEIGRVDAPLEGGVVAEIVFIDQPINSSQDPEQYGHGLIGFGKIRMHGASIEPTFVRVAEEPAAGATSLRVEQPVTGWAPASRLVLPGTNQPSASYQPQWEEPILASIADRTLQLGAALRFNHSGARNSNGNVEFLPHVGNLSRNVILRSANPAGTRGHVIFIERADVDIRYALFKDLGRTKIIPLDSTTFGAKRVPTHIGTNQIGRYSLHMHHLFGPKTPSSNGYQFVLVGNAIDGSTKWGITVHNSHFGLIKDNVVYDVAGVGIMTEDGSETGNVFDHNFVVRIWGTGSDFAITREGANDWGWEGSGLWFRGPNNSVRNNVVANTNSYAVSYVMKGAVMAVPIPTAPGKEPSVPTNMLRVPVREFANNEWYASFFGLTLWNVGAGCCTDVFELPVSTLKNTRVWHIGKWGVYDYGSNRVTFDGWVQRNDARLLHEPTTGFFFGDYIARNTIIRHADIQNVATAIAVPFKVGDTRDIYGTSPGTFLVEDSTLQAVTNVYLETPWGVTGGGGALPPRRTTLRNVRFLTPNGKPGDWTPAAVFPSARFDRPNPNLIVADEIQVEGFNGTPGDNFRVYYPEQAPSFVVPQTGNGILGVPVAGLTNEQSWARHHLAIGGAVAPCTTQRPGVIGFACPVATFESPADGDRVPAAPRDVRLLR